MAVPTVISVEPGISKMKLLTCIAALSLGTSAAFAAEISLDDQIEASRSASSKYWDISVAKADGYEPLFDCTEGQDGSMGQHFIHPGRAGDGKLVLNEPDVLMYEPQPDGTMQLVAIEYVVFEKDWPRSAPPSFMGQVMKRKTAVGSHPVDPFFEVHAWHWRHNPDGFFSDWNVNVSCR
jgi:hypothetical protein